MEKVGALSRFLILVYAMIFLIILTSVVSAATLVDSEDFESYTIYNDSTPVDKFINESDKWDCADVSKRPSCITNQGSSKTTYAKYQIEEDACDNSYLHVYALQYPNATDDDYKYIRLIWNNDNATQVGSSAHNYTLKYRFKINAHQFGSFDNWPGYLNAWSALWTYTVTLGSQEFGLTGTGGNWLSNMTGSTFAAIRGEYYYDRLKPDEPDTNCYISDGMWHEITNYLKFNSTQYLINFSVYVDGELCWDRLTKYPYTTTSIPFQQLSPYVRKIWDVSYDDIRIYDGFEPLTYVDLEILDVIPIQVVPDVDMVKDKSGYVRVVAVNNGPYGEIGNVSVTFNNDYLTPVGYSNKTMPVGTNVSFDFYFKPTVVGTDLPINASIEVIG